MSLLGNIIWILFGGIFTAIYWFFVGCLFCLTIVAFRWAARRSRWQSCRCCRLARA